MKMKFYYYISKNGELWVDPVGKMYMNSGAIVDAKKYNIGYSIFLSRELIEIKLEGIDYLLEEIEKIKNGTKECVESYGKTLDFFIFKDRVDFIDWFGDYDDWSCTIEEFTRALLGKKKFLEMPRKINSYLEIEINDL